MDNGATEYSSTQYRCTVKVNGTSQTSDALALTVKPAAEISGEISDRTITVIVTGLADGIKATVIVAQYSGAKLVDVRMESVTGNGRDICVEAAFTDENNEKGAAVQTDSSAQRVEKVFSTR